MSFWSWIRSGFALGDRRGTQSPAPSSALNSDTVALGPDAALQISAVWACVEIVAKTVASLPFFVYSTDKNGNRTLARDTPLWGLLHESPNSRMTPVEFWTAMIMNLILRGNAYARIERAANGDAYALWPMSSDQVEMQILDNGTIVYAYRLDNDVAVLADSNVLHIKEMGNGLVGLARLDYMRSTTTEATHAQQSSTKLFSADGKPSGVLMVDAVLNPTQRVAIQQNFGRMAQGSTGRLFLLEANMKYQQLSLSPEDMQLLQTRQFSVQEIARWFNVPSVLINQTEGTTTLGSAVDGIIESFYKTNIGPLLTNIHQAVRKRVMTARQRATMTAEFSADALLRVSLSDRMEIYAKAVQNGLKTRNECRQLENDPPLPGGDDLTVQTNLTPLNMLSKDGRDAVEAVQKVYLGVGNMITADEARELVNRTSGASLKVPGPKFGEKNAAASNPIAQ